MMEKGPWEALLRYWLSKHIDGLPPARRDLDPILEIPHLVSVLTLISVEPTGYRYRVVGSKIDEWLGVFITGSDVKASGQQDSVQAQWRDALDHVNRTQEPLIYEVALAHTSAKYTTLILPLIDRGGTTEMILVGCFPDGYIEPGAPVVSVSPVRFIARRGR